MVQLRTLAAELVRLLASIASPIYVLDDERRIVYANPACAAWLGVPIEDLIGQTCSFNSSPIAEPLAAKVAGLCPPPEVLSGARMRAAVSRGGGNGQLIHRKAEFIPLFDENENCAGVFAIAALNDMAPGSAASIDDGTDDSAAESAALHERLAQFHNQLRAPWQMDRLVGKSPAMARVRSQVRLAWRNRAAVVVIGPPGTGRQHVAKAIHYGQSAAEIGDLVPLPCSTLGTELLRSTLSALLGRQKVAAERPAATLLLTDVHELPAEVQIELAERLRGDPPLRIVSTAAEPLEHYASRGEFRPDLASALSTIEIHLPPLAERREDLPLLAQMFLEELNAQGDRQLHGFSPEALDQLAAYPWPGNIDELAAMVREARERAEGSQVGPRDLPQRIFLAAAANRRPRRDPEPIKLEEVLGSIELELIERAIRLSKGNKTKAALLLGLTRPRLYRRMVQLGLEKGD